MHIKNTSSTLTNSATAQQTTNTTTVASMTDAFAKPTPVQEAGVQLLKRKK